ncbi:MAG: hypothetical protein H7831_00050 [Magnetococcus sp. WYHC-3]
MGKVGEEATGVGVRVKLEHYYLVIVDFFSSAQYVKMLPLLPWVPTACVCQPEGGPPPVSVELIAG